MKTLKQLALFLLLGSSMALTSCSSDDPVVPDENKPTITIAANPTTAAPGETIKLTVNGAAEKELKNIKVTVSAGGASAGIIMDTTFANGRNTSGAITYDYLVGNAANYVFTATVTDRDGITATSSATVTVSGSGSGNMQICSNITLGAQSNSTYGSSYAPSSCNVYKKSDANTNSAMVDLVYFYGSTNMATIAAPNDNSFGTGATQISGIGVQDWATRNATTFKKLSGSFDFSGATDLKGAYDGASGEDSKANTLTVGDTYAYKTAAGQYGVFRVKAISGGQSGTIKIDSKTTK